LSGPAGAGKTTTVRVVAKEMGVKLMEWGEGADDSIVGAGIGELIGLGCRNRADVQNVNHQPRNLFLSSLETLTHLSIYIPTSNRSRTDQPVQVLA
jgi:hypothetical protein